MGWRRAVAEQRRAIRSSDLVLAVVLAVFAALDVLVSPDWRGPTAVNAVVVPVIALATAWRRARPLVTLLAVMGGLSLLSIAYGSSQTWTGVFVGVVAVYSAAAYGVHLAVVATVTAAAVTVITLRDPQIHTFGDAMWSSTLLGLTLLVGLTGRALRNREDALVRRAEALDRDEEERAAAAAAEERQRIARELHDIISHSLGVLVLQAGAAEQVLQRDPERAREVLKSIRATGQEAIGEMGTLLGLVRGEPELSRTPQPTLGDLDELLNRTRAAGLPVDVEVHGERRALPAAVELSAYRVVQEGLTNVLKHARATRAEVIVRYRDREVEVEVIDNGDGSQHGPGSRRGLLGLRERVAVFGGCLEAGPQTQGGWRVFAAFPVTR